MSWFDRRSKIVKNARILEKFKLTSFDADLSTDTDDALDGNDLEPSFIRLNPSTSHTPTFLPLENKPMEAEHLFSSAADSGQNHLETNSEEEPSSPEILAIRRKAHEEMERLKEETCKNCTLMEKEAWEKGFKNGETEGLKAGEKKAQPLVTDISSLLSEIASLKPTLLIQYEREILDLIFAVSEKIIHCEISLDQRVIKETVLHTLQLASEKESLILRLHPDDVDSIENLQASSADSTGRLTALSLKADPSVSRGGCHLETPHGDIDASIETRLKRVYETLIHQFEEKD